MEEDRDREMDLEVDSKGRDEVEEVELDATEVRGPDEAVSLRRIDIVLEALDMIP